MKLVIGMLILSASLNAAAKTKVDVPVFVDESSKSQCSSSAEWRDGAVSVAFQQQFINRLDESGLFNIVEGERLRSEKHDSGSGFQTIHKSAKYKASQYSLAGVVRSFGHCDHVARVAVEIRVTDSVNGAVIETFTAVAKVRSRSANLEQDVRGASFGSGLFRDSALGRATLAVLVDASDKLKKAFPERETASVAGYKVRTFRKPRRGR